MYFHRHVLNSQYYTGTALTGEVDALVNGNVWRGAAPEGRWCVRQPGRPHSLSLFLLWEGPGVYGSLSCGYR